MVGRCVGRSVIISSFTSHAPIGALVTYIFRHEPKLEFSFFTFEGGKTSRDSVTSPGSDDRLGSEHSGSTETGQPVIPQVPFVFTILLSNITKT